MKYLVYIIVSILIGVSVSNAQELGGDKPTFGKEATTIKVPLIKEWFDLSNSSAPQITFGKDVETVKESLPLKEEYKERLKVQTRTMKFTKEAETKKTQLTSK